MILKPTPEMPEKAQ